ncbi:MAG: arylesterase [Acidobacteria bacterium]|nr:arylesterase [Acidobacteriota bacterium]
MRPTTLLYLTLLVFGCSCSPTGEDPAGQPANGAPSSGTPAPQRQGIIVAFGDSLTAGFGVDPGESYPDYLQRELDRRGHSYEIINEGVSGDTSDTGLVRTDIVASRKPDLVIVAFGGNDGLRVLAVDRMKLNLRRMITKLQRSGIQVVLAGIKLPPNYGADYRVPFEQAFVDLAEELGVAFLPFLMEGVWDKPGSMQADGIHPTAQGHERIALNVLEVLEPLLKAKQKEPAAAY